MEFRNLFSLIRRWYWLLIVGVMVGLASGFFSSRMHENTYEASTKLLVSNELEGKSSDYAGLTNTQLVQTYIQLLKTERLRRAAAEKIGTRISASQVDVQQVPDTQIIEIKVQASDGEKAALIANTMVHVLIDQIEGERTAQFLASESKLNTQIGQLQEQIATLQADYDARAQQMYDGELAKVEKQITDIQAQISALQTDIALLETLGTPDSRAQVADKQSRITQLQSTYKLFDEMRTNLIVLGKTSDNASTEDPYLTQTKATIEMYQQTRLDLLTDLEAAKSARMQQTPNAVQIQEATPSNKPIGLSPMSYTVLSGAAGLVFAVAAIMFLQVLQQEADRPLPEPAGMPAPLPMPQAPALPVQIPASLPAPQKRSRKRKKTEAVPMEPEPATMTAEPKTETIMMEPKTETIVLEPKTETITMGPLP
ncbi:MAG: Wzz/FepE/Etk N-terminal domain-containing protein [Bacteroidota bacterium]